MGEISGAKWEKRKRTTNGNFRKHWNVCKSQAASIKKNEGHIYIEFLFSQFLRIITPLGMNWMK